MNGNVAPIRQWFKEKWFNLKIHSFLSVSLPLSTQQLGSEATAAFPAVMLDWTSSHIPTWCSQNMGGWCLVNALDPAIPHLGISLNFFFNEKYMFVFLKLRWLICFLSLSFFLFSFLSLLFLIKLHSKIYIYILHSNRYFYQDELWGITPILLSRLQLIIIFSQALGQLCWD